MSTYYVDQTGGDDGNDGLSEVTAWKTLAKVNNSSFFAGDSILFKRGEIWRETLTVSSSGSDGSPITFSSYGSGNDPIITGGDDVIGVSGDWTDEGSNVWSRSLATQAKRVVLDSTHPGTEDSTPDAQYEWDWSSNKLYIYSVGNPSGYYSSIEAAQRDFCVDVAHKSYITIENLDIKISNDNVVRFYSSTGSHHNIVDNCTIAYSTAAGIHTWRCHNIILKNSIIHDCGTTTSKHNVYFSNDGGTGSGHLMENCISYNSSGNGVQVRDGDQVESHDAIIRYNKFYDNGLTGIMIAFTASNCEVYYNVVYGSGEDGIVLGSTSPETGSNNKVYNNITYSNNYSGINVQLASSTIQNNILLEDNYKVHADHIGTVTTDYNCFYKVGGGKEWKWNGTWYYNFTDYKTASSQDSNSINSDPLFMDVSNDDFHLQSNSLCIDAGTDVGLTEDYDGVAVPQETNPAIGAFEYVSDFIPKIIMII